MVVSLMCLCVVSGSGNDGRTCCSWCVSLTMIHSWSMARRASLYIGIWPSRPIQSLGQFVLPVMTGRSEASQKFSG